MGWIQSVIFIILYGQLIMIGVQNGVQNGTLHHRNGTQNGQTGAITGSTVKGANHLKLPRAPKVQRVKVPKEAGFGRTIHHGPITTRPNGIDMVLKAQRVKAQRVKPPKVVVGEVIGIIIMIMGNVYVVHVPPPPPPTLTKNVPSRVMDIPSHTYSTYP